jgi:hypothetical protein
MMNTILKVISLIFCSTAILKAQPTVNELLCIHTVANETEMNSITEILRNGKKLVTIGKFWAIILAMRL